MTCESLSWCSLCCFAEKHASCLRLLAFAFNVSDVKSLTTGEKETAFVCQGR